MKKIHCIPGDDLYLGRELCSERKSVYRCGRSFIACLYRLTG